jgi:hypothetical protein
VAPLSGLSAGGAIGPCLVDSRLRVGRRLVAVPAAVARGSRARTCCLGLVELMAAADVWDLESFTAIDDGSAAEFSGGIM